MGTFLLNPYVYAGATVPDAPTIGTCTRVNDTTVDVVFTANSDGGSAITSYTIQGRRADTLASITLTRSDATDLTSPIRVTMSPVEGIEYEFRILATNAIGSSSYSDWSNNVTVNPYDAPGVPGSRTATVINTTTVDVGFTAPASDLTITAYTITSSPSITLSRTDPSDLTSPIRVTGSFSNAGVPGTPTSVSAVATDTDAVNINFTPPTNTGGTAYTFNISATSAAGTGSSGATSAVTPNPASITGYNITSSPSITLTYSGSDTTSPIPLTGAFATNTTYTFTIRAINANGTGTGATTASITPDPRKLCTSAQITVGCCTSTSTCGFYGAGTNCTTITGTFDAGAC